MRIGVIGSEGFLGSHLVEYIEGQGDEVVRGDLAINCDNFKNQIDVSVRYSVDEWFLNAQPLDAVITLAGLLGTHELFDDVERAVTTNTLGQYNVAVRCLELGIPMVTIEQPHVWTNPYETTRGAGVRLAKGLAMSKGLKLSTVTVFNAFGERQAYGGNHPQKIVPTFAVHAWNDSPAPIYGEGMQMTNLIYAGDIARVLYEAIGIADPTVPTVYGAAQGGNFDVLQVWELIRTATASAARGTYLPMRDGETSDNGARAYDWMHSHNERLGIHVPRFSMADLQATVDWYKGVGLLDEVPRQA